MCATTRAVDDPRLVQRSEPDVLGNFSVSSAAPPLDVIHSRLDAHFTLLSAKRAALERDAPVFALEHGLTDTELLLLRTEIVGAIQRRRLDATVWLPLVVYAAEIGYSYAGDEYWQTFEATTPGWAGYGQRQFVRDRFKVFQQRFNGARPRGPWADHFSIICWPITHAVLPKDLQRQLAQLLFDYRRSLTSDQLATPAELGVRLAARAWHTSSRFQAFAENTSLLGHVAAALLVGEDEDEPFLLDSTLGRIVDDLSSEHQARRWLDNAKVTAARVRSKGLRPVRPPGWNGARSTARAPLPAAVDPRVALRRENDGWRAYLEMPDFSILAERLPEVAQDLRARRALVQGTTGPPLARGRLLYPDQVVRLDSWPDPSKPLVQLEVGSRATNSLLADQAVLTPGPIWLFRLREPTVAKEVRGKSVRPGGQYVLLTNAAVAPNLPPWVTRAVCATAGAEVFALAVPADVTPDDLESVRRLGIGIVTDVEIRPVGIVPARWDGEGRAEWLTGEDPVLAISSSRSVEHVIITSGGPPQLLEWPDNGTHLFVRFMDLDAGTYDVGISLLLVDESRPPAEGNFQIVIRAPHTRPPAGSMREGLMLLASPAGPTLPEIWNGTAAVEILGPGGAPVEVELALFDRQRRELTRKKIRTNLPVDSGKWRQLLAARLRTPVASFYEVAERAHIAAAHPVLGTVSLDAERPFAPLRWTIRQDGNEAVLKLIDNTAGADVVLVMYAFSQPDRKTATNYDGGEIRFPEGGLLIAQGARHSAGIIVPRSVRGFADMSANVSLRSRPRTVDAALDLLGLAEAWSNASPPAGLIAQMMRLDVLYGVTQALTGLIAGERWARVEEKVEQVGLQPLTECIGGGPSHKALARELVERGALLSPERVDDAVEALAGALARHGPRSCVDGHDLELAECLLRLATSPGSLPKHLDGDLRPRVQLLIDTPLLVKAARLLVLATPRHTDLQEWAWQ